MLISYLYIVLLLTNTASIINIVRKTKSHEKQHSIKFGSIVGLEGIGTKPSTDIIAPNVGVTALTWGVISPQAMTRAKAAQCHGSAVKYKKIFCKLILRDWCNSM